MLLGPVVVGGANKKSLGGVDAGLGDSSPSVFPPPVVPDGNGPELGNEPENGEDEFVDEFVSAMGVDRIESGEVSEKLPRLIIATTNV